VLHKLHLATYVDRDLVGDLEEDCTGILVGDPEEDLDLACALAGELAGDWMEVCLHDNHDHHSYHHHWTILWHTVIIKYTLHHHENTVEPHLTESHGHPV
jgi:hypothetical protein